MADHTITVLHSEDIDISALGTNLEGLLAAIQRTHSSESDPDSAPHEREPDVRPVVVEDMVDQLMQFSKDQFCLFVEEALDEGEDGASEDRPYAWICVPKAMMPTDIRDLAARIILVPESLPNGVTLPDCSPEPEDGPGIYIEPRNPEAFREALDDGQFDQYVPEVALEAVDGVMGNCEINPLFSCPGILGCWT